MNKQKKATIILVFVFGIIALVGWIYSNYRKDYEKEILSNSKTKKTWAIYFEDREGKGIVGTRFYYYNQNSKRIEFDQHKYFDGLKFGDTVLIRYSLEDNSVVEILSTKWN